jgi:5'-3' exonuclease
MRPVLPADVLEMLLPNGGWIIVGDDFDSIQYDAGVSPITKKQFLDGFDQVAAWKEQQEATKAQAKVNLLAKLGITAEEAKLLLG